MGSWQWRSSRCCGVLMQGHWQVLSGQRGADTVLLGSVIVVQDLWVPGSGVQADAVKC